MEHTPSPDSLRLMPPSASRPGRFRPFALLVSAIAAAGLLAGCATSSASSSPTTSEVPGASTVAAFYTPPQPLPKAAPGTLIRSTVVHNVPGVPQGAVVWRILFHSTTITGADQAESGYVIEPSPSERVPQGGRPVIAWAHGTSGFAAPCAPSLFTSSGGGTGPYLLPGLTQYLAAGYAVAAADYQGLGVSAGVHPYLVGSSEGRAVLDATRAARHLLASTTANKILIYGHSQGGHAALFAGELAPTYAPDLNVLGVVAAAPATGLSTLISIIATPAGAGFLPFSIPTAWSWTQTYSDLPTADVFTPAGRAFAQAEVTNGCSDQVSTAIAANKLTPQGVFVATAQTNPVVTEHAKGNDPGAVRTTVPMLIIQGSADQTVPPPLTDRFVRGIACPAGDNVTYIREPGATHESVVFVAAPAIVSWMDNRVAGKAAVSTCP